jgi:hypothetical protein
MCSHQAGELLLAETAAAAGTTSERAQALLQVLRRVFPFDAAWIALADPLRSSYSSLASADLDDRVVDFLSGPLTAHDIEVAGADRERPPLSPSDLPVAAEEFPTWSDCLIPAGIHEALAVGLFADGGRYVGYLALLSGSWQPPSPATRRRLGRLAPVLAHGIDPMRSLLTTVRLVRGATAGTVFRRDGRTEPLPGLHGDPLLAVGSPVLTAACGRITDGQVYSSFLWLRAPTRTLAAVRAEREGLYVPAVPRSSRGEPGRARGGSDVRSIRRRPEPVSRGRHPGGPVSSAPRRARRRGARSARPRPAPGRRRWPSPWG